jgi:DNA polymerase-1
MNMPVQGTAADIVKMAMIKISHELKQKFPTLKILLQVHDELVFEIEKSHAQKAAAWIKREMENIIKLSVPLVVDMHLVDSWGEVKK